MQHAPMTFSLPLQLTVDFLDVEFDPDPVWDDVEIEVSLADVVLWRTSYPKTDSLSNIQADIARHFAEKIARLLRFETGLQTQDRY